MLSLKLCYGTASEQNHPGCKRGGKALFSAKCSWKGSPHSRLLLRLRSCRLLSQAASPRSGVQREGAGCWGSLKGHGQAAALPKTLLPTMYDKTRLGAGDLLCFWGGCRFWGLFLVFCFFRFFFVLFSLLGRMNWLGPCSQLIFYSSPASLSLVLA